MKNFKPNQKVVYRRTDFSNANPNQIFPKYEEIVTIAGKSIVYKGAWYLHEYPNNLLGHPQSFDENNLFPLEEVFSEQSQEDIERIESEIEKEQLITVTQ